KHPYVLYGVVNMSDLLTRIRAGEFDQPQEQKKEDAASILARIRAGEFDMPVTEPSPSPAAEKIKNAFVRQFSSGFLPKLYFGSLSEIPAVTQFSSSFFPALYSGSPKITEALFKSGMLSEPKTTGNERLDKILQKTGYFTGEVLQ